jgi:hypothetical protein
MVAYSSQSMENGIEAAEGLGALAIEFGDPIDATPQ